MTIYLPIYTLLYLLVAFVLPSYITYRNTGVNPIVFGSRDNAHDYIGFVMKVLTTLLVFSVMLYSLDGQRYQYLAPILYLETYAADVIGLILIHVSLLLVIVAQYQMGSSWRIGIDESNSTKLVTTGLFGMSRNPIFLGMLISLTGIFLIIPNALTFFIMLCTYFIIQIQIRLEEGFLKSRHGEVYMKYLEHTRRLI